MPRQNRKPLLGITRFNYWQYLETVSTHPPVSRKSKKKVSLSKLYASSRNLSRKQFCAHLNLQPCNISGCQLDRRLNEENDQEQRRFLSLQRYVESDRLWKQDEAAQTVRASLSHKNQKKIDDLDSKINRAFSKQTWLPLLTHIARDQRVFERIIAEKLSGKLEEAGALFDLSEAQTRSIYRVYGQMRQQLFGKITNRKVLNMCKRKGREPKRPPEIPRTRELDNESSWPMFGCDGQLIDYGQQGEPIDSSTRDQMVFHWFGHALRNLARYFNGKAPLPFQDSCATRCLKLRDLLMAKSPTANRRS